MGKKPRPGCEGSRGNKKKAAVGVALTVVAASVAANLAFQPEELLHDQTWLETRARAVEAGELTAAKMEYEEPGELSRADTLRNRLLRLPVPVKALLLLPLWAVGEIPVAFVTWLLGLSALPPILSGIAGFVLHAAVLVGVFCVVYKLLFPERSIKELFQKKNRRRLLLGAAAVTALDLLLGMFWSGWSIVRVVLLVSGGFGVLCLLWRRICGRFRPKEPGVVRSTLRLEY